MTSQVNSDIRYSNELTGLNYFGVKEHVFVDKEGNNHPWRQLILIDNQGDPLKLTLDKSCEIPDIIPDTPIIIVTFVDKYKKERVHAIQEA